MKIKYCYNSIINAFIYILYPITSKKKKKEKIMKRKSFLKVSFKVQVDLNSNTIFLYENKIILMYLNIQLLIIKKKKNKN